MSLRLPGGLLGAGLLLVLLAGTALAHAELVESVPADGETIQTPYTLFALFTQEMNPNRERSFIRVEDAEGVEVASGGVHPDDPTQIYVELPLLEAGEYTVRWQTTTSDDNGVERGTYIFNVTPPAMPTDGGNSPLPTPTDVQATTPPFSSEPTGSPPATASPAPTQILNPGQPTAGSSDVLLALILAGIVIGAIALFLFARSRR